VVGFDPVGGDMVCRRGVVGWLVRLIGSGVWLRGDSNRHVLR
jgi:hypothetical protein